MTSRMGMIKVIGMVAAIVGFGATLLSDWVDDQKMNEKIEEKVNAAIAERDEKES